MRGQLRARAKADDHEPLRPQARRVEHGHLGHRAGEVAAPQESGDGAARGAVHRGGRAGEPALALRHAHDQRPGGARERITAAEHDVHGSTPPFVRPVDSGLRRSRLADASRFPNGHDACSPGAGLAS